jgi:uncharacterized protein (TIGR02145 family)
MAENLNYDGSPSSSSIGYCYENEPDKCETYGRLYDWYMAQDVCPEGWHLPEDGEWTTLTTYVGTSAGTKLKATSGWSNDGNGTDNYGFAALPGGYRYSEDSFYQVNSNGYWWSATEASANNNAYERSMNSLADTKKESNGSNKTSGFSVRCLKD